MKRYLGLLFALAFVLLLAARLGFFSHLDREYISPKVSFLPDADYWMEITQGGKLVGLSHHVLKPAGQGFQVNEEIMLRIKVLGIAQEVICNLEGYLDGQSKLMSFRATLASPLYSTELRGEVKDQRLLIISGGKDFTIPLREAPFLSFNICRSHPGKEVPLFDALTARVREVKITPLGEEKAIGGQERFSRLRITYAGMEETFWCNERGEIVREEGPLGLVMERITEERAQKLRRDMKGEVDLAWVAAVPASEVIRDPIRLTRLTCSLTGIPLTGLFLDGGRQKLHGSKLIIEKENLYGRRSSSEKEAIPSWALAATPMIQTGHPQLVQVAKEITHPSDVPEEKVRRVIAWVHREIEKWPVASLADSVSILSQRRGDCTEHAILSAALGRTLGIPAAVETGLVYREGKFFYHAWNAFFLKGYGWVTADAVFNQFPADCTHIRFTRGDFSYEITPLAQLMGKLRIAIEDARYDPT